MPSPKSFAGVQLAPRKVGFASLAKRAGLAGAGAVLAGVAPWDYLGRSQPQWMGEGKACVQSMPRAGMEGQAFKSGCPSQVVDVSAPRLKISADFLCGDAVKSVERWNDARGARLADRKVPRARSVGGAGTLDFMNWRQAKPSAGRDPFGTPASARRM